MKSFLCRVVLATTVLLSGTFTYETLQQTHVSHAAVNYYSKNSCAWYVFNRRAQLGKPVSNQWGNAKHWVANAKRAGYRVGRKPARHAVMQSPKGRYGHVVVVEHVYRNGSIKVSEYNYNRPYSYGTRILSRATARQHHFIY